MLVLLTLFACEPAETPTLLTPAGPQDTPIYKFRPEDVPWRWDVAQTEFSDREDVLYRGGRLIFDRPVPPASEIRREDPSGDVLWRRDLVAPDNRAQFISNNGTDIFCVFWDVTHTGARLERLSPDDGSTVWTQKLDGVGAVDDSGGWFNRIQIWTAGEWIVVYGDEKSARYVEVRDPANGELLHHRIEE